MESSSSILLKGGIVLQHDDQDQVNVLRDTDLLVEDGVIVRIGKSLSPVMQNTQVIDCSDKIVSPGFIDTHHHVWQTPLKGRHSDDTLLDYFPKGNAQNHNFTSDDIFWAELGGMLEALDGGTTCVVDHAHMTNSVDRACAGVAATLASGLRSIFCYTMTLKFREWTPEKFELQPSSTPDEFLASVQRLSELLPTQNARVSLGLGFDSYFLPETDVVSIFDGARKIGVKLISSHWHRTNLTGSRNSVPQLLQECGLLKSDVLIAHANGSTDEEYALMKASGVYVSSTPGTETQMGHGEPMAFRPDVLGSLGVDCNSNNPGTMLDAMRTGLAVARCSRNSGIVAQGKFPRVLEPTTLQAFNLATIGGARAVGLGSQIGSLVEGKLADIIVIDTSSPAMVCAADENPLAAVVRHANPQDIEFTIVAGRIRKEHGTLRDSSLKEVPETIFNAWSGSEAVRSVTKTGEIQWKEVVKQLRRSRAEIVRRDAACNHILAREKVVQMWTGGSEESILL